MKKIIQYIKNNILDIMQDEQINIFLCGAETSKHDSLRDFIHRELQMYPKVNIVFPEWLFPNLLTGHEHNLLTLENELAQNVDLIIIPLEGLGSFCELGSFANYSNLVAKILVINEEKYRRIKSFINEGPIKLIRQSASNNIIWEDFTLKSKIAALVKNRVVFYRKAKIKKQLSNLFDFSYFIGQYLSFSPPLRKSDLMREIRLYVPEAKDVHFEPALEILLSKKYLNITSTENDKVISVTKEGFDFYLTKLGATINNINTIYKMRSESLYERYKLKEKSNFKYGGSLF